MADESIFICSDGHRLAYNVWMPEQGTEIKAYVQILHGMAEYSSRYDKFAKFLTKQGFAVFAGDHRGHGHTADEDELGWFSESDGWNRIAADAFELANFMLSKDKEANIFLFGHSMGSFLARTVMVQHPNFYNGVVIMGTAASKGLLGRIGKIICKGQVKKKGQKSPGYKMNKLSFGSYNKAFEPAVTDFDWLSRDQKEVAKYVKDPLCGFLCTNGFFLDMLTGIEFANSKKNAETLPKDLPIMIISGDQDPVGNMGKDIYKVFKLYKNAGLADVKMELVPGARHELLNETNRKETYSTISNWLSEHL